MHRMNNAKLGPTNLLIQPHGSAFFSVKEEHTGRLQRAEMRFLGGSQDRITYVMEVLETTWNIRSKFIMPLFCKAQTSMVIKEHFSE